MTKKRHWVICVCGVGSFQYWGTAAQAETFRVDKARWEQAVARRHLADTTCLICAPAAPSTDGAKELD